MSTKPSNSESNIHKFHRSRMREKYEKHGGDVFETHQLLEMLLYHAIKQGDTNPLAHDLLSLCDACSFSAMEQGALTEAHGAGVVCENLLKVSSDTVIRMLLDPLKDEPMDSEFSRKSFLWLWFKNKSEKTVALLMLNGRNRFVDCVEIAKGKTFRPEDYLEAVKDKLKSSKASKVIICHNHMDNVKSPSVEDVYLTGYLKNALLDSGVELLAHYVVTETDVIECNSDN